MTVMEVYFRQEDVSTLINVHVSRDVREFITRCKRLMKMARGAVVIALADCTNAAMR